MLALAARRQSHCDRCSEPLAESTSIESEGRYRAVAEICHACAAVDVEVKKHTDHPHSLALRYKVTKPGR